MQFSVPYWNPNFCDIGVNAKICHPTRKVTQERDRRRKKTLKVVSLAHALLSDEYLQKTVLVKN